MLESLRLHVRRRSIHVEFRISPRLHENWMPARERIGTNIFERSRCKRIHLAYILAWIRTYIFYFRNDITSAWFSIEVITLFVQHVCLRIMICRQALLWHVSWRNVHVLHALHWHPHVHFVVFRKETKPFRNCFPSLMARSESRTE